MTDNIKSMDHANDASGEGVNKAREAVQDTLGAAKDKLSNMTGGLDGAREKFSEVRDGLKEGTRERVGQAKDGIRHGYDRARKDMDQLSHDVNVYVRDNPGRSVLIAAGAGFLLGFLLRGERRR